MKYVNTRCNRERDSCMRITKCVCVFSVTVSIPLTVTLTWVRLSSSVVCDGRKCSEIQKKTDHFNYYYISLCTIATLTKTATREEIFGYVSSGNMMELEMNFPCHTKAVERHIKLVTKASSLVLGSEATELNLEKKS